MFTLGPSQLPQMQCFWKVETWSLLKKQPREETVSTEPKACFEINFSFWYQLLISMLSSLPSPLVFLLSFNSWGFRWLCQRCLMVNVPLYLNICGLSSSIFWYRFITRFYSDRKTGSIWFQHLETMKFLPWVLCPCICSSGSRFVVYGNLNTICIPLLCENCINLLYVESVRTAYPGLLYSSASLYIHG